MSDCILSTSYKPAPKPVAAPVAAPAARAPSRIITDPHAPMNRPSLNLKRETFFSLGNIKHERLEGADTTHEDADHALLMKIVMVVERHYQGWPWEITCDSRTGVALISLQPIMGVQKYVMHISYLNGDPRLDLVKEFAGQILERFGLPRGPFDAAEWVRVVESIPFYKRGRGGFVPA
jgi:hypothetical protein